MQIPLETWTNLSIAQKRKYLNVIINLSNDELGNMKTIDKSLWNMDKQRIHATKTALLVKLSEAVNILHADTIEKKALDLLNCPNTITLSPTLTENEGAKTYLVAGKSSKEAYNVSVLGIGLVKCNCRGFKFTKLCSHSVAVSEKDDMLRNHVDKVKGSRSRSAITYPLNAKGSVRKGGQKHRQRLYHPEKPFQGRDEENASKNPFT